MQDRKLRRATAKVDIVPYTKHDRHMVMLILIFAVLNLLLIVAQIIGLAW